MAQLSGAGLFGEGHWCALADPSAESPDNGFSAAMSFRQPFGIEELTQTALCLGVQAGRQSLGIGFARSVYDGCGVSRYALSGSLGLGRDIRAGAAINLVTWEWKEMAKPGSQLSARLNFRFALSSSLVLAAGATGPHSPLISTGNEMLRQLSLSAGLEWKPKDDLDALFIARRDIHGLMALCGAARVRISKGLRLGISYNTLTGETGISLYYNNGKLGLACVALQHPLLGLSPGAEVVYFAQKGARR